TGEQLTLARRDAADGLHHRVEAATRGPWPDVAEGAQRDDDDPRAKLRERLRREASRAERPGPIALGEHVTLSHDPAQGFHILRLPQVEVRRELAVAGVVLLVPEVRQMRRGDLQDVGTVLGERARARRPGEHASEIEHTDAR